MNQEFSFHSDHEQMEARLWDYLDNLATAGERQVIERLIAHDAEWRAKYQELLQLQQMLQSTSLEEPSMRFTKNVMEEIAKYHIAPATKNYINKKIIYGIAAFFITVIVSFIVYGFSQVNWSAAYDPQGALGFDLGKVNYQVMFNNSFVNIFMMLNVVLALMLLDRYLSEKRKKWSHH